jgi:hypothetical protein
MDKKLLKEILAAHADHLVKGKAKSKDYLKLLADPEDELAPLLNVAEQVKSTLKPVRPGRKFENRLKRELLATAHLRRAEGYVAPNPQRDLLMLAAIIGFVLSLAGVLLALRLRNQTGYSSLRGTFLQIGREVSY